MDLIGVEDSLRYLPRRAGRRPLTTLTAPFRQRDQWPPAEIHTRLLEECLRIPDVRLRRSRMAPPDTWGLYLPDGAAAGPPEAFIDQHEFCHVHALPAGGLHLVLPHDMVARVVDLDWAARHPMARYGVFENLVMLYAPRDPDELQVVLNLMRYSCFFAAGALASVPLAFTTQVA